MPKVGTLGLDMMFRTCTVQVSIFFYLCLECYFHKEKHIVALCLRSSQRDLKLSMT